MNRIAKKLAVLLGLTLVVGLFSAVPSMAATIDATCGVAGTASVSPAVKVGSNGPNDPDGTYTFDDLVFACAGTVNGVTDVATSDITTSGDYNNNMCGFGTAKDTDATGVIDESVMGNTGSFGPIGYEISFTAGVGTLSWTSGATGDGGTIDIFPLRVVKGMEAVPDPVNNPEDQDPNNWDCTKGFGVAGEVDLQI